MFGPAQHKNGRHQGNTQGGIKRLIPPKLPTTDAEFVANLINANMWL